MQSWESWSPKRRRVVAVAGGAAVLLMISAGAGLAASLGVPGTDLGISSVAANCQTVTSNPITPDFVYEYQPGTPGYAITDVTLSGLQASCLDKDVTIVLANSTGTSVATASGVTPSSGTTATIPLASPFPMTSTLPTQMSIVIMS